MIPSRPFLVYRNSQEIGHRVPMIGFGNLLYLAIAASLASVLVAKHALSDPLRLYGEKIQFDVYRKGVQVGSHTVTFEQVSSGYRVESDFGISIRFLSLEAYRFRYRSEALWRNGGLNWIKASVDENGEDFRFEAVRAGDAMRVQLPDGRTTLPAPIFPTNHWNAEVLTQKRVLNTLTGRPSAVAIVRMGEERVPTENGEVLATRYVYTGDLETEVWYDAAGRWVKMRFEGSDGSIIDYVCRRCQGDPARTAER